MAIHQELNKLSQKIEDRSLTIGIIGLGYVGLPLSLTFMRKGVAVIGYDLDQTKIDKLSVGESYIKHIPSDELGEFVKSGQLSATNNFNRLNEPDAILI